MAHAAPGELFTMLTTAIALGSDAMSLGIGLGMTRLSRREIAKVSTTIGIFHVIMPLVGMAIGLYLHRLMGDIAMYVGSAMLILLGLHMIWDAWTGGDEKVLSLNRTAGIGLLLFAMSVSIDALSVGFSFGLSDANLGVAVTLFGIVGAIMAAIGLSLGSMMGKVLGDSMAILGGMILIFFGIQFLV